jgi:hypothetical protein
MIAIACGMGSQLAGDSLAHIAVDAIAIAAGGHSDAQKPGRNPVPAFCVSLNDRYEAFVVEMVQPGLR